jgi:NAD(P)-dependent dehydrogenase (short-subunit alcohol dehydrogenase family)
MPSPRTALIVGASRGLGRALAREYLRRGWRVIATVRDAKGAGPRALREEFKDALEIETIDIAVADQIVQLRRRLDGRSFDLLFVNAGVANGPGDTIKDISTEEFMRVMTTNTLGPLRVMDAFVDLVRPDGVVAAMTSGLGSVADNDGGGWEVYRASKAALNTLVRSFAARQSDERTYLVVAPGWVRTDMGGPAATLGVEDSIPGIVDAIAKRRGSRGATYIDYRNQIVRW